MKTIEELKEGECVVITDHGKFQGFYRESLGCVFFAIPSDYKILGYEQ